MNFRTTVILIALLAGGALFLFIANRHISTSDQTTTTSAADEKGKKLFEQKPDDIASFTIQATDGSSKPVVLTKDAGNWKITQPVIWPADSFEARNLVDGIVSMRSQGGIELGSANITSTGLDHPRFTIDATDTAGKTIKLQIGERSTLGNNLYVKVDGESKGQLVASSGLADKLDKGLDKLVDSLRDKQLVKTPSMQMKQVEVSHKDKKILIEKSGADWKIVEPLSAPADTSAVTDLLMPVTDLRADEFIDPASSEASDAGFDRPKAVVWFSTAEPATTQATTAPTRPAGTTVTFGQFASVDRDKLYVKLSDPPIIAKVAMTPMMLDRLTSASALTLRDKKVLDVDPASVTGFTLAVDRPATTQPATRPAEQYELTINRRKEAPATFGPMPAPATQAATQPTTEPATQPAVASTQPASKWIVESGGSGNANDTEVDALLTSLHPLTAIKYLEATSTTEPSGSYTLTLHVGPAAGKGPQDYTLRITNPGATGNAIGSYQDLIFELDRPILDKLDAKLK